MTTTEDLICLVYSKPEVWDQTHKHYSSKDMKLKAWNFIGEKMKCTVNQAKVRWTNLRDLFRRELKKTIKMAKMTGDTSYVPRWKHFKAMLFLKDQMVKDDELEFASLTFDESISKHYPQTILEDENSEDEEKYYLDYHQSVDSANHMNVLSSSAYKRHPESASNGYDHSDRPNKRHHMEEPGHVDASESYLSFASNSFNETDEDYHFVMSILPSVRRIRPDRKTSFKMKVLQLIIEEENCAQE